MQIYSFSTSNNISYKGIKQISKATAGAMVAGLATITSQKLHINKNESKEDLYYEDLSKIEESDGNIFDEEYYQAYYNIDLNLAYNSAFRDNELFNPLRDTENYEYRKYDEFDIKHADNLIYKKDINKYTTTYKLSDTDFGDTKMPRAVTNPNNIQSDDLKILDNYVYLNKKIKQLKIDDFTKEIILNTCRRDTYGFNEVDFELVKIALDLYENDKKLWCTEEDLLDIINILKKYDSESDEYKELCNHIKAGICAHKSNHNIYNTMRDLI